MVNEKEKLYVDLEARVRDLLGGERNFFANAANVSALLYNALPDINWVGFYLLKDRELVLGPFQGKPACTRIPMGKGVCGSAAVKLETIVVDEVEAFPGHIACDSASRSEIVVPLIVKGQLIGVLDIDSPSRGRFDDDDRSGLEKVMDIFLSMTEIDYP